MLENAYIVGATCEFGKYWPRAEITVRAGRVRNWGHHVGALGSVLDRLELRLDLPWSAVYRDRPG